MRKHRRQMDMLERAAPQLRFGMIQRRQLTNEILRHLFETRTQNEIYMFRRVERRETKNGTMFFGVLSLNCSALLCQY